MGSLETTWAAWRRRGQPGDDVGSLERWSPSLSVAGHPGALVDVMKSW